MFHNNVKSLLMFVGAGFNLRREVARDDSGDGSSAIRNCRKRWRVSVRLKTKKKSVISEPL